ncbi:MAG: glycosyltransferase family 4 protein [Kiritimatiellae bacterium]|nr:glycosyltransferase family 4 protein [Kiritimatiellia bacterium]
MKRILYITNKEVPYRVQFFNELARHCDLTVLVERHDPGDRDRQWAASAKGNYRTLGLGGMRIGDEWSISPSILKYMRGDFDAIVIGCYNSPVEAAGLFGRGRRTACPVFINLDGEQFFRPGTLKTWLKKVVLRRGDGYLAAGEQSAQNIAAAIGRTVWPFYFSSLTEMELAAHRDRVREARRRAGVGRNDTILVVSRFLDVKGLDIALRVAAKERKLHFKFVGLGNRTDEFRAKAEELGAGHVEIVPFLQRDELEREYLEDRMLVLPSRQECWGLVVNEAASFGMPIVATTGVGSAVEFLVVDHPEFLAKPGDDDDLRAKIDMAMGQGESASRNYGEFLLEKSKGYSIERMVASHVAALGLED